MTSRSRSRTSAALVVSAVLSALAACDRPGLDRIMADYEVIPSASVPVAPLAPESPAPSTASAAPPTSVSTTAPALSASANASSSAPAAASASKPPEKTFDCGDKGKPDCPMQRWMKGLPSSAVSSGDPEKLVRAFNAIASHPPPGMGAWVSICATGASIAASGDFDGAKKQCKACHARYQAAYRRTMRDMPWP